MTAPTPADRDALICNCLALRQAARHVTQFYDEMLAPAGLRSTQYSVLSKLNRLGPLTINALAAPMVMDRTTLGRNMLPLQRDGLIAVKTGTADRRSKELHLTKTGAARYAAGRKQWIAAQAQFEIRFGSPRSADLRSLLHSVTETGFAESAVTA
jgi:DNA-binding MarR family transcriptional regulator